MHGLGRQARAGEGSGARWQTVRVLGPRPRSLRYAVLPSLLRSLQLGERSEDFFAVLLRLYFEKDLADDAVGIDQKRVAR